MAVGRLCTLTFRKHYTMLNCSLLYQARTTSYFCQTHACVHWSIWLGGRCRGVLHDWSMEIAFIVVFVFTRVEKSTSRKWAPFTLNRGGQEANPCPPALPPQSLVHCRSTRVCTHKQTHTRTHVLQHTHRSLRAYQFYEWNSTLTLSVITSALVEGKSLCTCLDAHACQPRVLLSSNSNSSNFHS